VKRETGMVSPEKLVLEKPSSPTRTGVPKKRAAIFGVV